MSEVLEVAQRKTLGKLNNRRLRASGKLPAVLYGHGEAPLTLEVSADQVVATLRHGAHVVELRGGASGQALLQAVQWDVFQQHVLHLDLLRVDATERITVELPVVLQGEAPGESEGGIIEHLLHSVEIETSPSQMPDALHLKVNDLHLGGAKRVSDIIDLPSGAKFVTPEDGMILHCVAPSVGAEEEAEVGGAEPELVGRTEEESGDAE